MLSHWAGALFYGPVSQPSPRKEKMTVLSDLVKSSALGLQHVCSNLRFFMLSSAPGVAEPWAKIASTSDYSHPTTI